MTDNVYVICPEPSCKKPVLASMLLKHKDLVHSKQSENPNDVQYYSEHARMLLHSQQNKIAKFIAGRCIQYAGAGAYICLPLKGYNTRVYRMIKDDDSHWTCTCQAFNRYKDENPDYMCSHIGTLYEYFSRHQKYD